MEGQEKLKNSIYPPEIEITSQNNEIIHIKINENFTNNSNSENKY